MDTFLRLRKKFKFHKIRLTYQSLARMSLGVMAFFFVLAFVLSKFTAITSETRLALMASKDYESVEKELTEYLSEHPSDEKFWRLLVRLRSGVLLNPLKMDIEAEEFEIETEEKNQVYLKEPEFLEFLKKSESALYEALKFRYDYFLAKDPSHFVTKEKSVVELKEYFLLMKEKNNFKELLKVGYEVLKVDESYGEARKGILLALSVLGKEDEVEKLIALPEWKPFIDNYILHNYHLEREEFGQMFYYLTLASYERYTWQAYLVCGLAGFGWLVFLVHLGSGWFWKNREKLVIPVALILGMMSAVLCLGVVVVQDFYMKHEGFGDKSVAYNLAYCILGIGLREEVCKMLLFLPILYFVKGIRHDYKILCYCSLVGLGFAIEENLGYYSMSNGDAVIIGRFLTANFAHIFLTGFTCFYLVKAVQRGGKAWDEFTVVFIKMVVIHGGYDFFLLDPTMLSHGASYFAMLIYVYMAIMYLRLLLSTAPPAHQFVSLTRVFMLVLTITMGVTFLMLSLEIGLGFSFKLIFSSVVMYAIIAYMFFREFNERIGSE